MIHQNPSYRSKWRSNNIITDNIKLKLESSFSKTHNNIIMIENQLKDMQNKRVISSDNKKRLNQFILWRIQYYTTFRWKITLSVIFAEDFQQFIIKENFDVFDKIDIIILKDTLRENKVYVKKTRLYSVTQTLANVIKEDISWSLNDENRSSSIQQQFI